MNELLQEMPVVVFRGICILPGAVTHFDVNHPKAIQAVKTAMSEGGQIFLVTQKDMQAKNPTEEDLYRVGLVAEIRQVIKQKDKTRVIVMGKRRAELAYFVNNDAGLRAQILFFF